ncbi:MAG: thiamine phosphate synthase [Actinobacteria bacterium]|nr:thiamine phosphate synthase [Actinomycetota bacterium]
MNGSGRWRRDRLRRAPLYLCTDRRPGREDLARFLEEVLAGGVDIVQLRDKDASASQLREAAATVRAACRRHEALFVVNDDPWLAAEVDADGVHVGQDDPSPDQARTVVGPDRLIGRSTHDVAQIDRALAEDCDMLTVGPVSETPTKRGRPGIGLDPLRHAAAVAGNRPWFVSGGMAADTAPTVLAAGGRRLVVVRALTGAADPRAAAAELSALLAGTAARTGGAVADGYQA